MRRPGSGPTWKGSASATAGRLPAASRGSAPWLRRFSQRYGRPPRRRQRRGHPCLLGCDAGEDSLEHYCECQRVWCFGFSALGVSCRLASGKEQWFLTAPEHHDAQSDPRWWQKVALLHYAVLRATNGMRAAGLLAASPEEAGRALQQGLIEARAPPQLLAPQI
jgi:hypothetical protein